MAPYLRTKNGLTCSFQDRFIEVFEKRLADGVEITALACANGNGTETRIAVGTRKCVIQVFQYDGRGDVTPIFSIRLERVVSSSLSFTSNRRDVLVFGMYDGAMYVLCAPLVSLARLTHNQVHAGE